MHLQLDGRSALVTGATAGIGLSVAKALAREGVRVIVAGRERPKLDAALREIRAVATGEVAGLVANTAEPEGAETVFAQAQGVDILINNLGTYEIRPFAQIADDDWRRFFETNVLSGIRLARYFLPDMLRRNWGRIVFVSSATAVSTPGMMVHYGMTKTAELAISRGLAEQTKGTAVTVNAVLPGAIRTSGMLGDIRRLLGGPEILDEATESAFFKTYNTSSLLQRLIEPAEVADLVAFLASPLAAAINGGLADRRRRDPDDCVNGRLAHIAVEERLAATSNQPAVRV